MRKLLVYMKNYRAQSVAAPLFKMTEALFELFVPLVVARFLRSSVLRSPSPRSSSLPARRPALLLPCARRFTTR